MKYRLWDVDINRLHGTFDNEADALAFVRTLIDAYGEGYADDLELGVDGDDDRDREPLSGRRLVVRVREAARRPAHVKAG